MIDRSLQRAGRPRGARRPLRRLAAALAAVAGILTLSGCTLPIGEVVQGGGLPTLRHLDWGYPYYEGATWAPNGRWIALWAGPGVAQTYLVVLSPDGHARWDLSGWGCGGDELTSSLAWLPDSALSCITETGMLVIGAYPFTSPTTVPVQPPLNNALAGAAWTPDGTAMIVTSITDPADPVHMAQNGALYRVDRSTGTVTLQSLTPHTLDVEDPAWAPHQMALSYLVQTGPGTGILNLLLSPVTIGAQGALTLGPPQTLATDVDEFYTWSPSGRWIAVRHGDYRGGDKIYLLNPANPTQRVDVVLADRIGQQMMHPIWSPDGQTLIVFSVAYDASQPYSLDIGAYLRGKGVQP